MKTKKKRTKRYSGSAVQGPVVKRYDAVERSRLGQWAYERKGRIKIFGVLAAVVGLLTLLITGIAGLFS